MTGLKLLPLALGLSLITTAALIAPASAAPVAPFSGVSSPDSLAQQVQWRRGGGYYGGGYRGGRGRGGAVAAGVIGGLALGAIIAGSANAGPGYYAPPPAYYPPQPAPVYAGGGGGEDWVDYCFSKYKSFDPRSGTYLGYDGLRHPCQ